MKKWIGMAVMGLVVMTSLPHEGSAWPRSQEEQQEGESYRNYQKRRCQEDLRENGGLLGALLGF